MQCPHCGVLLTEILKAGVPVDVCDQCRGIWLDRGELEQILGRIRDLERDQADPREVPRGASAPPSHAVPYPPDPRYPPYPTAPHGHQGEHHEHDDHHGSQQRKGWRGMLDMFD